VRSWPTIVVSGIRTDAEGTDSSTADLVQAALSDYAVSAIDEPAAQTLRAFFQDDAERDRAIGALRSEFPQLQLTAIDVPDEDWAARSQANLTAIQVGQIVVTPPWDTDPARLQAGTTMVIIQPSMGFGTGHHATTRLCLAALQQAHVRGRSVIDVGTGSGVLAIAASLLGASPVVALDDDPDAIQSARENLDLNPGAAVDLRHGDLRASTPGIADVVLANLTGALLIQAAPHLRALVSPRGRLILSGLLLDEAAAVVSAFPELAVLDRTHEDEWGCVVLARPAVFE
jgi:ribosomal protein L11 methyltransferase